MPNINPSMELMTAFSLHSMRTAMEMSFISSYSTMLGTPCIFEDTGLIAGAVGLILFQSRIWKVLAQPSTSARKTAEFLLRLDPKIIHMDCISASIRQG